ncbi:MAG TPA: type II toxin-antitoxin system VapC family toxin [Actinobacteria bacterium]|nr:type II toxin-antitoxin system VapC family toxin [Actinomycetota bacterium]
MLAAPDRVGQRTTAILSDQANSLLLSAASVWEIAIKYRLGKLVLPQRPDQLVPELMRASGVVGLPVEHGHALFVATLDDLHTDPFDRLLVAQALVEGVPIVTSDHRISAYEVEVVDART